MSNVSQRSQHHLRHHLRLRRHVYLLTGVHGGRAQQHVEGASEAKRGASIPSPLVVVCHAPEMSLMWRTAMPILAHVSSKSQFFKHYTLETGYKSPFCPVENGLICDLLLYGHNKLHDLVLRRNCLIGKKNFYLVSSVFRQYLTSFLFFKHATRPRPAERQKQELIGWQGPLTNSRSQQSLANES